METIWIIEVKECGYSPLTDGDWKIYTCAGFGCKSDADKAIKILQDVAEEYTVYRAVEYARKGATA